MKKIYLASASKARRKMLKNLGIKFRIIPVKIRELKLKDSQDAVRLVKKNALKKAKEASKKIQKGIVVAADTIVVQGKEVYGKPKNLKEARLMLKKLSRAPHILYSAIAVIEKEKGKVFTDYEKTKIYMDSLSDKEIREYFRKEPPLDKAGGFDIQGKGAYFIRRIEGCFYNVVGLPVRKLYLIFKKLNIAIFSVFITIFVIFLGGCSTEYNIVTGEQETYFYSTDREVQLGRNIDKQVRAQYKMTDDPLLQKKIEDIGNKIAAVCDRKEISYHFDVIEEDEVNAVSLPGGYVYIFKGLIDKVGNDDELAAVIAHEVGHIVARHSIKKLQASQAYSLFMILAAQAPQSGEVATAADALFTQLFLAYSREDELLADQLGARYAKLAGYDPAAMITFLRKLQDINRRKPLQPINYFKTHPYIPDRIRTVKEELGKKMNFDDYINIEQLPHK